MSSKNNVNSDGALRIELLGGLVLRRGNQCVDHFKTRRVAILLARLVCFHDRPHPRDVLAEELWPEEDPETIRERFRQTLALLRRELEPSGVQSGSILNADRFAIRLIPQSFTSDVADFHSALERARQGVSAPDKIEMLDAALSNYSGELMPGFYEDWIVQERTRLAGIHCQALCELAVLLSEVQRTDKAIATARLAIKADPLREESHQTLIRLLMSSGRVAEARKQYDDLERLLQDEVHSKPSPATLRLIQELQTPPSSNPVSRPAIISSLPTSHTRFFGRDAEIRFLVSLLVPSDSSSQESGQLVTVSGPGGAGKTRLALESARQMLEAFKGAVWFVPLADISHVEQIADAIVDALGLTRTPHGTSMEQAADYLNVWHKALLILDNFEHLQEEGVRIVGELRRRAPALSILVTSRHKLNLDGERDVAIPPLAVPESTGTPEQIKTFPSIQLFMDRAQAARYSFELNEQNAEAVATLGKQLEGIPLAIELAAAWAATLTPEQILTRLSRRFDLLVSRRRDIPERHRSLQAALEGSYQLLPPRMQRIFSHLSVFRGGFTLQAVEQAIAHLITNPSGYEAMEGLALLQERSFLQAKERDSCMRYYLLESLREFGAELLEGPDRFAAEQRHAGYYLEQVRQAQSHYRTPEEKEWLDRLEADHENLRTALEWSIENELETALLMTSMLTGFWMTRGFATEGRDWLKKALDKPGEMSIARADCLCCFALMHWAQGEYEVGAAIARDCLTAQKQLENESGIARALNTLASIVMEQGDYREAQTCYEQCLVHYRTMDHQMGEAIVLANLGNVVYAQGEYELAREYYSQCLATRRALGDQRGIASVLDYLARAVRELGDYQRAGELHAESLSMRRALDDRQNINMSLNHLALIRIYTGEYAEARELLEESQTCSREIGDRASLAESLHSLGELSRREGDITAARAYWRQSLEILHEAGEKSGIAEVLESLAGLADSKPMAYRASQVFGAAASVREDISNPIRPSILERHNQIVERLKGELGEDLFEEALTTGRNLPLNEAVSLERQMS